MTQNKKIAVTGGIGSGKTALCNILREWGYPVFSCDEFTAELWRDEDFLRALADAFPDCRVGEKIDKGRLTERVFSDGAARKTLENMTQPAIMERLMANMRPHPVAFGEVPLLYESGYEGQFDGVIALRRAEAGRIAAVQRRSGLSEEEIRARMRSQIDASTLPGRGCYLIENDGSLADLERGARDALRHFGIL